MLLFCSGLIGVMYLLMHLGDHLGSCVLTELCMCIGFSLAAELLGWWIGF